MYDVIYLREGRAGQIIEYTKYGSYPSLDAAALARKVSGDLIFKDNKIVEDDAWLFWWEKKEPDCYAQRNIREKVRIPSSAHHLRI